VTSTSTVIPLYLRLRLCCFGFFVVLAIFHFVVLHLAVGVLVLDFVLFGFLFLGFAVLFVLFSI